MDYYQLSFIGLVAVNTALATKQYRHRKPPPTISSSNSDAESLEETSHSAIQDFETNFYLVYCIAVAADWMQGPHIYALYKYEKNLSEKTVAALYASGFISGAVSASFVGSLADKHGRRSACLVYCLTYSLCCLSMLSSNITILTLGRILGGVSTTLLFSVFETWMISDYHRRGLNTAAGGLDLSSVFGRMTTLSSIVAILVGVLGDILVQATGSRTTPFLASICCLCVAAILLLRRWKENYGESASTTTNHNHKTSTLTTIASTASLLRDPQILALALTSTIFEGTMYLFIFFWSASLKSPRVHADPPITKNPPFGLIFSCFMCAMMLGSLFFTQYCSGSNNNNNNNTSPLNSPTTTTTALTLPLTLLLASSSLLLTLLTPTSEVVIFTSFLLYEFAIGVYFPSMGSLKNQLIHDGNRAKVYGLLRLPLNVFVVVGHSLAEDGDRHRERVFLVCSGLLLGAVGVGGRWL
jgi:MFS family permease